MLKSNDMIRIIDSKIETLEPFSKEVEVLIEVKAEIKYQEDMLINEMATSIQIMELLEKEQKKKYAYGKGILSDLKQDKDFVCPLCDGTHGNNAKCQI